MEQGLQVLHAALGHSELTFPLLGTGSEVGEISMREKQVAIGH
jgi:hypothetical protein